METINLQLTKDEARHVLSVLAKAEAEQSSRVDSERKAAWLNTNRYARKQIKDALDASIK